LPISIYTSPTTTNTSHIYTLSLHDALPISPICALSLSEHEIKQKFDIIIIDEAHHEPAKTWQSVLENMKFCRQLLFTATPFRREDRKSTRLNSSHVSISYAVFCLKKKNNQ